MYKHMYMYVYLSLCGGGGVREDVAMHVEPMNAKSNSMKVHLLLHGRHRQADARMLDVKSRSRRRQRNILKEEKAVSKGEIPRCNFSRFLFLSFFFFLFLLFFLIFINFHYLIFLFVKISLPRAAQLRLAYLP
jgi:hypothetical protein